VGSNNTPTPFYAGYVDDSVDYTKSEVKEMKNCVSTLIVVINKTNDT
jgi:hypothetical protein